MKFWKARMSMEVICSICNFGLYNLCRLWAHLVYKTYLDNCIVPACFSPLVLTLILVSYTVFIACQWFSSVFVSSVIHLAWVCIDCFCTYCILICNLCLLVDFKFCFALYIKFNWSVVYLGRNVLIYSFLVFYYESLTLNTINCANFCLCSWHETYKNVLKLFSCI